jgi:flagellar biosynthesis protein FlhB
MKMKRIKWPISLMGLKKIFDGTLFEGINFVKEIPYILLLIAMAFIYISNQYEAEKNALQINNLQKEIRELREKSISFASELMLMSKPSEISKMVEERGIGLMDATKPPVKIILENKKSEHKE